MMNGVTTAVPQAAAGTRTAVVTGVATPTLIQGYVPGEHAVQLAWDPGTGTLAVRPRRELITAAGMMVVNM